MKHHPKSELRNTNVETGWRATILTLFLSALCLLHSPLFGQTPIHFSAQDLNGSTNCVPVTMTAIEKLYTHNGVLVYYHPTTFPVCGTNTVTNFWGGIYNVTIQGIPQGFVVRIPDQTNQVEILSCVASNLTWFSFTNLNALLYFTNALAPGTNVFLTSLPNGTVRIDVPNIGGGGGANVQGTNGVAGSTNGAVVTLQADGSVVAFLANTNIFTGASNFFRTVVSSNLIANLFNATNLPESGVVNLTADLGAKIAIQGGNGNNNTLTNLTAIAETNKSVEVFTGPAAEILWNGNDVEKFSPGVGILSDPGGGAFSLPTLNWLFYQNTGSGFFQEKLVGPAGNTFYADQNGTRLYDNAGAVSTVSSNGGFTVTGQAEATNTNPRLDAGSIATASSVTNEIFDNTLAANLFAQLANTNTFTALNYFTNANGEYVLVAGTNLSKFYASGTNEFQLDAVTFKLSDTNGSKLLNYDFGSTGGLSVYRKNHNLAAQFIQGGTYLYDDANNLQFQLDGNGSTANGQFNLPSTSPGGAANTNWFWALQNPSTGQGYWTRNGLNFTNIPESGVANLPADLGGKAATNTSVTINGTANQIISSAGAQTLDANRTWTLSFPNNLIAPQAFTVIGEETNTPMTSAIGYYDSTHHLIPLGIGANLTLSGGSLSAAGGASAAFLSVVAQGTNGIQVLTNSASGTNVYTISNTNATSLTIAGTANQVNVAGGGPVALGGTATLSLPNPVIAPGPVSATAFTNQGATASTLDSYDANKKLVSVPNGSGSLYNNGSGGFSWTNAAVQAGTNMLGTTNSGVVTISQLDRQWAFGNGQMLNAMVNFTSLTSGTASNYMTFSGVGYAGDPAAGKYYGFRGKNQQGSIIIYKARLIQDVGTPGNDDHFACMSGLAVDGGLKAFVGIEQGTNRFEVVDRWAGNPEVDDVRALPYALTAGSIVGIEEYDTNAPAYGVVTIVISDWTSGSKVVLTNFNHVVDTAWTNHYTNAFQGEHSFACVVEVLQCDVYDVNGNLVSGGPQWLTLNGDNPVSEGVTNGILTITNHSGQFKTELSSAWVGDGQMAAIFTPQTGARAFGFAFHANAMGYRTVMAYDFDNNFVRVYRVDPSANVTVLFSSSTFATALKVGTNYYTTLAIGQGTNYTFTVGNNVITWSDTNSDFQTGPYKLAGYCGPVLLNESGSPGTMLVQPSYINSVTTVQGGPIAFMSNTNGTAWTPTLQTPSLAGNSTAAFIFATNTIAATNGFASYATNTYTVTTGGYTNLGTKTVKLWGFTGTSVVFSNSVSRTQFSLGTVVAIGVPQILNPNESLTGTSCAAAKITDF